MYKRQRTSLSGLGSRAAPVTVYITSTIITLIHGVIYYVEPLVITIMY